MERATQVLLALYWWTKWT